MQAIPAIDQISPANKTVDVKQVAATSASGPTDDVAAAQAPNKADLQAFHSAAYYTQPGQFSVPRAQFEQVQKVSANPTTGVGGADMKGGDKNWLQNVKAASTDAPPAYAKVASNDAPPAYSARGGSWDSAPASARADAPPSYAATVQARTPQPRNQMMGDLQGKLDSLQSGLSTMHDKNRATASSDKAGGADAHDDLLSHYEQMEVFTLKANVLVTGVNGTTHSFNSLLKGQ